MDEPPIDDEDLNQDDDGPRPLYRWRRSFASTPAEMRESAAMSRFMEMVTTLYGLYVERGVSDPDLYPVPPETLEPDYAGPEEDGFPSFGGEDADLLLGNIGRLVAAMGGHLELQAVFRDATISLLVEPGPEQITKLG